ncbi:hypothetical protein DIS18_06175 [Algibacter marinivivus]|uniref:Uncharacterized protein n=1 Tax=Algibacter marinivivus TaxID=2100723 RepID=A0A2U2X8J6_9FLAO|nr:hypothetical protein [Algibacter marinivivus]PWH84127.1 hypothetical protein DIS18_06175 [Algibacter marinivivus]
MGSNLLEIEGATNWLSNSDNIFKVRVINDYLKQNSCNAESKNFSELAVEAWLNDGDLEFEKLEKFYVQMNKECQAEKVFDLIINSNVSLTNFIKNEFGKSTEHHIQFEDIDLPDDVIAGTIFPDEPILNDEGQNGIILNFDNSYLDNASNLSIVLTAAHEFVHIRLGYLYIKGELLNVYPDYTDINDAFITYYDDKSNANRTALDQSMHDVYDDFLDEITDSVFNYATNNNITGATRDYCEKMVLGAHQNTNAFQGLTPEQQTEYSTIIVNENEGKANAKGSKCE